MTDELEEALQTLGSWLDRNVGNLPIDKLDDTLVWVRTYAQRKLTSSDQAELRTKICKAFSVTEEQLFERLRPTAIARAADDDFICLVPKHGWLHDYIDYTMFCEAPSAYHFFTAATMVGAVLKRNVWKDQGLWRIYPNFATLLVGPSTATRKTTAGDIGVKMALNSGQVRLVGENFTAEALVKDLAEGDDAIGLAYVPELAATISKAKYNEALIPVLTRLWDCPDVLPTSRITRSKATLYNVALSFLGCSNEAWLVESIPDSAFKGGFMARIQQIYCGGTNRRYPEPPKPASGVADSLRDRLEMAGYCHGEIFLTRAGSRWYDVRYNEILDTIPEDDRMAPFYGRLPDHLLRMAIVLRLAENDFTERPNERRCELDVTHLEQADAIMGWVVKYLPRVYAPLGLSQVGEDLERIKRFLRRKGGVATKPEIVRHMAGRITSHQLRERMEALLDGGEIEVTDAGLWAGYKLVERRR